MTHVARGFFVVFTALFAAVAGYYTLRTTISTSPASAAFGAAMWGTMIFMIDRELVGHWSRRALWIRLVLSAVLGTIVAIPAEMWMLEKRIDQQIAREHAAENAEAHRRLLQREREIGERQSQLEKQLAEVRTEEQATARNREAEEVGRVIAGQTTGIEGRGPAYRAAADRLAVLSEQRSDLQGQLRQLLDDRQRAHADYEHEQIGAVYDFPSRYEAMNAATPIFSPMWRISWLLTIAFILIDMTPVLMKAVNPATEHDHVLAAEVNEKIVRTAKIAEYNEKAIGSDFMSPQPSTTDLLERIFGTVESQA